MNLKQDIQSFLEDCQARQLSHHTVRYYRDELTYFTSWLVDQGIYSTVAIQAEHIRRYLLDLEKTRAAGGLHASYRAIRAYLNWFEQQTATTWANPIRKLRAPKVKKDPLPGSSLEDVRRLLAACGGGFIGDRDRALILTLLDTGLRRSELHALVVADVDLDTGRVQVRNGKGNRDRAVFLSAPTRQAIRAYLAQTNQAHAAPLWLTDTGERLTLNGIRQIIRRRSGDAGIKEPGLHDFRRLFAVQCLRNGMPVPVLARLMGHSNYNTLQRYLSLIEEDLAISHAVNSPVGSL